MRNRLAIAALLSVAGTAEAGGPLATIQDVVVGSGSSPRALQGIAAATLPSIGTNFFTSTGSCVPVFGTGNGLSRFSESWSLVGDLDYGAEPCHFGDITVGSDGTIYAPASEFDGIGFTNDQPFQINRFSATDLSAQGAWNADDLFVTYGFEDLSGVDYRHGDLLVVDYRDSSPDATNIYVFDLAIDPPPMIDLFSIASRQVNGIETYGNLLFVSRDINTVDAALDVYDLDMIGAGVNTPIDTYVFDISNGSSQLGQHSEGLTFRYGDNGVELWVSAAVGTIARQIALPAPPQRVTWTGVGSSVDEPFDRWGDYDFGWDGQPTSAIDAVIEFASAGAVRVDGPGACNSLVVLGDGVSSQRVTIDANGALAATNATIVGASLVLNGGSLETSAPLMLDAQSSLRGEGDVFGSVTSEGLLEPFGSPQAGQTISIDGLTLTPTSTLRLDVGDGSTPARVAAGGFLVLDGMIEVTTALAPDACVSISVLETTAATISGAFATEALPMPAPGMRTVLVEGDTSVNFVQTRASDMDANLLVDGADLGVMLGSWGQPGLTDLNGDGVTDGADLGLLLGDWGACG